MNLKNLLSLFLFMGLSLGLAQRVGDRAADFQLVDDQGKLIQLSDFAGTPLIFNAWASWCVPCVEELPFFERIHNEVNADGEEPLLNVLLINNNESFDKARTFLREDLEISLPTALDATKEQREAFKAEGIDLDKTFDVLKDYRVRGMPTTFFIDSEGIIQSIKIGLLLPGETPELLASIGIDWNPNE